MKQFEDLKMLDAPYKFQMTHLVKKFGCTVSGITAYLEYNLKMKQFEDLKIKRSNHCILFKELHLIIENVCS